jgi:hypothetical protein
VLIRILQRRNTQKKNNNHRGYRESRVLLRINGTPLSLPRLILRNPFLSLELMQDENVEALKTIFAAVHHYCILNGQRKIPGSGWECIASYLHIPKDTKYCLAIDGKELLLMTDLLMIKYIHHDFHSERLLHITKR